MSADIIRADALALPLADASVDLIVTSPPYFGLRSYQDGGEHYAGQIGDEATPREFVDALIAATAEMVRVLKPSGSIWINLGDSYYSGKGAPGRTTVDTKSEARTARRLGGNPLDGPSFGIQRKSLVGLPWRYALRCIDDLGLILRAEVVWSKPNGLPESVTDRVRRSHETWFHFTKEPRYFAAVDEIREPHTATTAGRSTVGWKPGPSGNREVGRGAWDGATVRDFATNPLGKLPGSVWEIPTQPLKVPAELGIDHFAAFPMEWPRRIVRGWSPQGGTVLDPFSGTGTTALVAHALGRHGIGVDLSADYCRLARWRTSDPGQLAAAMGVEKPPVEGCGTDDLLSLLIPPAGAR
ncbi:DNA-methyltransferase [Enterococcus hirae]|uniref:DNA-methyltransferase n=1 Tax=Enterococcus hirae TaxID=1354 RepID=UPI0013700567|nr:site-specific DNA-methyltransferase [Enterococcus hirae]NAE18010.1 site-specific DNA-methyltransferase [Enterococcus hirae]